VPHKWLLLKNTDSGSDFATSCLLLKRKRFYETKKIAHLGSHKHRHTVCLKLAYFGQGKQPESAKIFTREFPFCILRE
jgi:hypothetical protein